MATHVVYNSDVTKPAVTSDTIADLHTQDRNRVQKCVETLDRLHSIPDHIETVLITDSNGHKVKGRQLDPDNRSSWVLSSGGLCIPSAVHALQLHDEVYPRIQKVSMCIGTNDFLHRTQHVADVRGKYLEALREAILKVFPNACMYFVLPFSGGKVPKSFIDRLNSDIESHIIDCVVLRPPDMRSMFSDGVHLKQGGITRFLNFLQDQLVPRRPATFSRDSGRQSAADTYADSLGTLGPGNFRVPQMHSRNSSNSYRRNHQHSAPGPQLSRKPPHIDRNLVAEVTEEVVRELMSRNLIHNDL